MQLEKIRLSVIRNATANLEFGMISAAFNEGDRVGGDAEVLPEHPSYFLYPFFHLWPGLMSFRPVPNYATQFGLIEVMSAKHDLGFRFFRPESQIQRSFSFRCFFHFEFEHAHRSRTQSQSLPNLPQLRLWVPEMAQKGVHGDLRKRLLCPIPVLPTATTLNRPQPILKIVFVSR